MTRELRKKYGNKNFEAMFHYHQSADEAPTIKKNNGEDLPAYQNKLQMKYRPIRPLAPKDMYRTNHWGENSNELKEYKRKLDNPNYWNNKENLQRKMMIRILLARKNKNKNKNNDKDNNNNKNEYNKYVWATGGHSAAAGHGNLFLESYTKVMETTASSVFSSVGLHLEARNYAMGATASAAEMSMCFKEIYGDDVDIFSWDFGMLEARFYLSGRLLHYATRGLLSNQREGPYRTVPAFVGLQEVDESRKNMMVELHDSFRGNDNNNDNNDDPSLADNNGLAFFLTDKFYWKQITEAVPDSAGLEMAEIDALPEYIRHFKCDNTLEKGEPFCLEKKYNETVCKEREGLASWHPGWKYHALLGNSMALFLTEMLVGAVQKLDDTIDIDIDDDGDDDDNNSEEKVLARLLRQEETLRDRMLSATPRELPESYDQVYWYNNTSDNWEDYPETLDYVAPDGGATEDFRARWNQLDRAALFHGPSICHTARLPAQTRFAGTLTNHQPDLVGEQAIYGRETYYVGIDEKEHHLQNEAKKEKEDNDNNKNTKDKPKDMQLVTIFKERQQGCGEELAKPDYHDYFMAEESEHWTKVSFPNAAEQKAYNYEEYTDEYKGMLVIVPRFCAFDSCEEGFLGVDDYNSGKWEIIVNGVPVTALTKLGHEAILLEHKDGIRFDRNKQGRYELKLRVNEPDSFIKISAFIMY
uniref:Uncharacterized protein n=1 Tax=Pseudo-nitzschia australis TaxID=44445 RepID=A0A7S4EK37_9STRA